MKGSLFIACLMAAGLVACRRPEVVRTVTVKVPVPVPCPAPARLPRPTPPAALLDALATDETKAKAIAAWVLLLQEYARGLELQLEPYRKGVDSASR